jgi:hypothetical protein
MPYCREVLFFSKTYLYNNNNNKKRNAMDARSSQCSVPSKCVDCDKINRTQVTICIIGCYLVSLRYIIIVHFGKRSNYLRTDHILHL